MSEPVGGGAVRPTPEQVALLAPDPAAAKAAAPVADPAAWSAAGHDEHAVWGRYLAAAAEPYEVAVDLRGPAYRCSCPSRKLPCKHALGLLLLHAHHHVAAANRLPFVDRWLRRRTTSAPVPRPSSPAPTAPDDPAEVAAGRRGGEQAPASGAVPGGRLGGAPPDSDRDRRRLERAERMRAGLVELDRWLADRVRAGLAAPALADPATWERAAARLVDAQCGGLANRVRRVASRVGQHAGWHEEVLEELALLHALARGAQRTSALPEDLADGVHLATGLTIAKDDVLATVPSTAEWLVAGESRTREDRITVQRTWLCSLVDGEPDTWAMLLAFGAFGNEVTSELPVGVRVRADVHWYPGGVVLRALLGHVHAGPTPAPAPHGSTVAAAIAAAGSCSAREPWIERVPILVRATPVPLGTGRWSLSDASGSVPIVPGFWRTAELVAVSGGRSIAIAAEWSVDGVLPLTVWADGLAVQL
jgi:hypothetical protein